MKGGVSIKKIGRPFSDNPKDIRFTIRLDKRLDTILKNYAEKNNITKNEAARRAIERLEENK